MDIQSALKDGSKCECGGTFEIVRELLPWLSVVEGGEFPRYWSGLARGRCTRCGHERMLHVRAEVASRQ